ncbi:MAG: ABC transporter substrate-binding protein [Halanaerobiales bacterium]|nr:ABC transporter substrate-binding protein [Halanaerobiales bacterium]
MKNKFGVLLLSLILVFSVVSIVGAQDEVKSPNTYTHVTIGNQSTLDPHYSYDTASSEVIDNVYECLIQYQGKSINKFSPLLSTEVPSRENGLISEDGTEYTFPIREGVKFSNGNALTPEDVKYSFMRGMVLDRTAGPLWMIFEPLFGYAASLSDVTQEVVGVEDPTQLTDAQAAEVYKVLDEKITIDGNKVTFHLANPYPPFLNIVAQHAAWSSILDKEWSIKQGAWDGTPETIADHHDPVKEDDPLYDKMMGTGPFVLTEWVNGDRVVFKRNENYWRKPANFKTVIIKNIDEPTTRILLLQRGDADSIALDYQYFSQIEGNEDIRIEKGIPVLQNLDMLFNWTINTKGNDYIGSGKLDGEGIPADFFTDVHVRKGFSYVFNYKAFMEEVRQGQSKKLRGPIVDPLLGYDEDSPVYELDLEKAEEHFKQAWDGQVWEKGFKMTILYNSGNMTRKTAADIFKSYLEQLNPKFDIDTRAVQWSTFLDESARGTLPLQIGGWLADFPDPHNFVQPFLHSQGYYGAKRGENYQEWAKENVDPLIDEGISELDRSKREGIYKELQSIAHEQAIDVWIDQPTGARIQRNWVKGWYPNPMRPGQYFYILDK